MLRFNCANINSLPKFSILFRLVLSSIITFKHLLLVLIDPEPVDGNLVLTSELYFCILSFSPHSLDLCFLVIFVRIHFKTHLCLTKIAISLAWPTIEQIVKFPHITSWLRLYHNSVLNQFLHCLSVEVLSFILPVSVLTIICWKFRNKQHSIVARNHMILSFPHFSLVFCIVSSEFVHKNWKLCINFHDLVHWFGPCLKQDGRKTLTNSTFHLFFPQGNTVD